MRTLTIAAVFQFAAAAAPALTARVAATPAGPRLMIDGQPTIPRTFFGSRRPGASDATPAWQTVTYRFKPSGDADGNGTLHFRFGQQPGVVKLRHLTVTEAGTGRAVLPPGSVDSAAAFAQHWTVFPPGERNNVGTLAFADDGLTIALTDPPAGSWPDFHLYSGLKLVLRSEREYTVSFEVMADPARAVQTAFYRVAGGVWTPVGGPPGVFLKQVGQAADAGVRIVTFGIPSCWLPPDEPADWTNADIVIRELLDACPDTLLLPRVGMNAPPWWLARHPESRMLYDDGHRGPMATVSDRRYRADAAAHLERLCRHLTETYPDRFLGIHPCGQNTGEWFYEDSWLPPLSGYAEPAVTAWKAWLQARGELAAEVPAAGDRRAHPHGLLRDPVAERQLVLFEQFRQEEMADFVLALAAAARRGTGGTRLVVFFYGYVFEFAGLPNHAPISGHYALRRVLDSPDIDVLCAPISYYDRQWLGTGACMTAAESVALAGKLWLNEDDTRTHHSTQDAYGKVADLHQSRHVMLRNTAQAAIRGFGTWWMDLFGDGWFDDPAIWDIQQQLWPTERAMLARTTPFAPEVALVIDERSMCYLAGQSRDLARRLIYEARAHAGRCGAPYGQYLLDDAVAGKVPAKLQVHVATFAPSEEERTVLRGQTGTSRLWCYAPGWLTPAGFDAGAMRDLTGFDCRAVTPRTGWATPTAAGTALGLGDKWGAEQPIAPLFGVDPAGVEVLATWDDGSAAVALRRKAGGGDVFCAVPALTPELLRACARLAGAHVWAPQNAAVWADAGYLSLTPMADGELPVTFPRAATVFDALTGERLGHGRELTLQVTAGGTRVLRWE